MTNAAVSLIIPIYNAADYLQQCLGSVTEQTMFARMEVLLVDDGSTDASPEICDVWAQKYENIQVLHRKNAGVSAARNAGLDAAHGQYIAFADADDYLFPQMIEQLYAAAAKSGAALTFCDFCEQTADGEVPHTFPFDPGMPVDRGQIVQYMLTEESFNALWHKLFLASVIRDGHIRMTVGRRIGEDREFILEYLTRCETLCYVPVKGYYYRYVPGGAVRRPQRGYAKLLTTQYATDREQFARLGVSEQAFKNGCAVVFCRRIAATIDVICRAFSGTSRQRTLRVFFAAEALQTILRALLPIAAPQLDRYTKLLLFAMRHRLVMMTRLYMRLAKLRTELYQKRHGGARV